MPTGMRGPGAAAHGPQGSGDLGAFLPAPPGLPESPGSCPWPFGVHCMIQPLLWKDRNRIFPKRRWTMARAPRAQTDDSNPCQCILWAIYGQVRQFAGSYGQFTGNLWTAYWQLLTDHWQLRALYVNFTSVRLDATGLYWQTHLSFTDTDIPGELPRSQGPLYGSRSVLFRNARKAMQCHSTVFPTSVARLRLRIRFVRHVAMDVSHVRVPCSLTTRGACREFQYRIWQGEEGWQRCEGQESSEGAEDLGDPEGSGSWEGSESGQNSESLENLESLDGSDDLEGSNGSVSSEGPESAQMLESSESKEGSQSSQWTLSSASTLFSSTSPTSP
eukprot:gene25566-biopygen1464